MDTPATMIAVKKGSPQSAPLIRTCRLRSKFSYALTMLGLAMTFFYNGYCSVAYGTISDNVTALLEWSDSQETLYSTIISAMIASGQILGSIIASPLSHRLGRQNLVIVMIVVAYLGLALTAIEHLVPMIIGRLISNLSAGVFLSISPIIAKELSPKEYDPLPNTLLVSFIYIGNLFGFVLGFGLPNPEPEQNGYWRFASVAGSMPLAIGGLILLLHTKSDSGKFIYSRYHNEEKARAALARIYKKEEVEKELETIKEENKLVKPKISFKQLCRTHGKQIALGYAISLSQMCSGISFTGIYCNMILQRAETDGGATDDDARNTATLFSTIAGIAQLVGCIGSFYWMKACRRKPLYLVLFGLGYIVMGLYWIFGFSGLFSMQKYCVVGYYLIIGAGLAAFGFTYLPAITIDSAFGIVMAGYSTLRLIDVIIFPLIAKSALGIQGTILIYWIIGMLANAYFMIFSVETKGVSEADIYHHFNCKASETHDHHRMHEMSHETDHDDHHGDHNDHGDNGDHKDNYFSGHDLEHFEIQFPQHA